MESLEAIINNSQQLTIAIKVSVLNVCVSHGYSWLCCVRLSRGSSRFFTQFLLCTVSLVIVSLVFLNFATTTTAQKINFSIKDFSSKCDQIRGFLWIWSHLLEKSLMEKLIFCVVYLIVNFLYWYSHFCNNRKLKLVKILFVNLITAAVIYCRYVIDTDIVKLLN